jgi:Dolichyl-phosphate-mannose-protein mannosyltransferase
MREILHILFGAAFTVALCVAAGRLLLLKLHITLYRYEAFLFAFITGAACVSLGVFVLCVAHEARRGVFLWGGGALIACSSWLTRKTPLRKPLPGVSKSWLAFFFVIFAFFWVCYFFNALAPEVSADGSSYHLGNVARIWLNRGFVWNFHSMYSYLSEGMEMLFLVAFVFGKHSSAAMVHMAFQTALPLLMVCYGRRFGMPRASLFAAILVYASPVIGLDGVSAYNDLTVATVVFAEFYALQLWDRKRDYNLLILSGLLAGFGYAVKYTAFIAAPFAALFVWWRLRRPLAVDGETEAINSSGISSMGGAASSILALLGSAAVMIAPWVLRNWIWLGNPTAPFLNRWFPNPYYHPGMEKLYLTSLRHYVGINHFWEIPLQLTMRGGLVEGLIGPVFLLAPLALLALRYSQGRRLLLAAAVFGFAALFNTGARFLIPSLPFLSLAMGLAFRNSWGVMPALAVFHAWTSWPSILRTYCDPFAWRVDTVPVNAALRLEPEPDFIGNHISDYRLKDPIEREVRPDQKIFSFSGRPTAYIHRDIYNSYESSLANFANDTLLNPFRAPSRRLRFSMIPGMVQGVRLVETRAGEASWTVSEMRVFSQGRELAPKPGWDLRAWPNGWEVGLAFDNNYATRWSSWQSMSPGMFIEADFGRLQMVDAVTLECEGDWDSHMELHVLTGKGWVPITDTFQETLLPEPRDIRHAATKALKAHGFAYLLVNDSDFVAEDMRKDPALWGITQLAEVHGSRFYRID